MGFDVFDEDVAKDDTAIDNVCSVGKFTKPVSAGYNEIVGGNGTSYNYYPPMGSGRWGSNGWDWAAYQRQIWYFDGSYNGNWTSLGSGNECTGGTSMLGPYWGGSDWGIYFFFGGAGGWC